MLATWDMHPARNAIAAQSLGQMFAPVVNANAAWTRGMLSANIFMRMAMPLAFDTIERAAKFAQNASSPWHMPKFDVPGADITTQNISPFFDLVHFKMPGDAHRPQVLLFAPASGHDATILNDAIKGLSARHDVYVCAPIDASQVPAAKGPLTLDAYIDTMQSLIRSFKGDVHTIAVSQPGPLLLAAVSLMEARRDPYAPRSASFIGCPIDPRINPTEVNRLTTQHGTGWFEKNAIAPVAPGNPGAGRMVYPGMMQMSAFSCVSANADEEVYHGTAIADLDATYFTQTIDRVFMKAEIPSGTFIHTDADGIKRTVNPAAITRTALLAVEGERDQIAGPGQTRAALDLATSLSPDRKAYHQEPGAGHYGIVHGHRWQQGVLPKLAGFIAAHEKDGKKPLVKQALGVS